MGKAFNTAASITAAIINRSKRKKTIKNIRKANIENRNVSMLGNTSKDYIIPLNTSVGNIFISGGDGGVRDPLIVQSCSQAVTAGVPVIIIHEGNHYLEHTIQNEFKNQNYLRIINSSNPFYEPIYQLPDREVAQVLSDVNDEVDASVNIYIKAVSKLLRAKGIFPYIRMLSSCPHSKIPQLINEMEQSGYLTSIEADTLRNDISSCSLSRPKVEYLLNEIQHEADILAWKSNLARSTSIRECIQQNGIIMLDIVSASRKYLMALINAELKKCIKDGSRFRVILDIASIQGNEEFVKTLKEETGNISWTISCSDIFTYVGSSETELTSWLAMTHKTVLFTHGIQSSMKLAHEIGEYDYIDITEAQGGSHNMGQFGYHFGSNTNINTTKKREAIIKPEEIERLEWNGFILVDNFNSNISKGVLV